MFRMPAKAFESFWQSRFVCFNAYPRAHLLSILRVLTGISFEAPDDRFGCTNDADDCWAGVYVDDRTKEVLYLSSGGRAWRSPGTQTNRWCLWWRANGNDLHLVDCNGRPFRWPGAVGNLRRESQQAGRLAGFHTPESPPEHRSGQLHLARDPLGFLCPGCLYLLTVRSSGDDHQHRVVFRQDGTIADVEYGNRLGTWSLAAGQDLGDATDSWAAGDTLKLQVKDVHGQVRRLVHQCVCHGFCANCWESYTHSSK